VDAKTKILITSVLKPADDVRSCDKIGQSLAQTNKYEVNIIGFESKKKVVKKNISLYPIFKFQRNSLKRLLAPYYVLKKYLQVKPKLIIVTTPELLLVIYLIRILFGTRIIYDIQENYRMNIKQNKIYRGIWRPLILLQLKVLENISKYFVDAYFIAEKVYEKQLSFIHRKPFIKLLNKSVLPLGAQKGSITISPDHPIKFIYSGTIGEEYGTKEAIQFCQNVHEIDPTITLTIVGYSPDRQYFTGIKKLAANLSYITFITDDRPIPHSEILAQIKNADVALLPYQLNSNIAGRFPTKIYDYLALGIPMIIPVQHEWKHYLDQYQAGISVDFLTQDIESIIKELCTTSFYLTLPKDEILWESQSPSLLKLVEKILSK
jgi:glycosyltransferase involved in cell wall biosynthesis